MVRMGPMTKYVLNEDDVNVIEEMTRKVFLDLLAKNPNSDHTTQMNARATIKKAVVAEYIAQKYVLSHDEKIQVWQSMYEHKEFVK